MFQKFLLLILITVTGCITYRNFPTDKVGIPPTAKEYKQLYYKIENESLFSGSNKLKKVFQKESPFETTENVYEKMEKGLYVRVVIESISPSLPALLFGYTSLSSLTIFPFWSTKDGYDLTYEIYRDGKRIKGFNYKIRRKVFMWIVMAPFSWINAFTYSESEAFEATAYKFFDDAKNLLK